MGICIDGITITENLNDVFIINRTHKELEKEHSENMNLVFQQDTVELIHNLLLYINQRRKFIVQETEVKPKKVVTKIPRTSNRSEFTILDFSSYRKLLVKSNTIIEDNVWKGHYEGPRRAHLRWLKSEKYIHMKGQCIQIPSTWVGPSECTVGTKQYKVILDK